MAKKREHAKKKFSRNIAKDPVAWESMFIPEAAGWIPDEDRTAESQKFHEMFIFDQPTVSDISNYAGNEDKDRPRNWELVKMASEQNLVPDEILRKLTFKNIAQIIGSCVGFGAGNMLLWASLLDAIVLGQWERILIPFVPYHYGRGRFHGGIRGPGSGSFGSAQAKALGIDGYLAFDLDGLPDANFGDAIYWTQSIEYSWSDGARIDPKWMKLGQEHTVNSVRVTSTDEAQVLADSHHVFTIASNWGGRMQCPIKDGVLLNDRSGTWNHQMWVLDYIKHPRLGRLWWVGNNWRYPHGVDPGGEWDNGVGAPPGGFYILDRELQYILSKRDSWAFTDPKGVLDLTRKIDWNMFKLAA